MKFSNAEHALRWSYETSNKPIVKISSVNEMRGPEKIDGGASSDELTAHDYHAQAALILGLCERALSPLHMAYVRVQFGREASGFDMLARHLAANFGTGVHSRRGIEQIIRAYCGQKIGLREMRKSMSCGMLKAATLRNQGYDVLDKIHLQAMDILYREMENRGLLRSAVTRELA
ncbi:hypothetical protein [Nitrosovibrio tenuis]|uniref:Uncharacterized protein n=1 Tax=Nitrosovibrio tenuis TaxID=1233 RepID=A0A1H7IG97_9PROT|nr:hypothetical protein [Nitrosovibrio tenuis]SEK61531.1 hypothetical protein SAMN05216387_102164 [Nitrosovibrio tenuis]